MCLKANLRTLIGSEWFPAMDANAKYLNLYFFLKDSQQEKSDCWILLGAYHPKCIYCGKLNLMNINNILYCSWECQMYRSHMHWQELISYYGTKYINRGWLHSNYFKSNQVFYVGMPPQRVSHPLRCHLFQFVRTWGYTRTQKLVSESRDLVVIISSCHPNETFNKKCHLGFCSYLLSIDYKFSLLAT